MRDEAMTRANLSSLSALAGRVRTIGWRPGNRRLRDRAEEEGGAKHEPLSVYDRDVKFISLRNSMNARTIVDYVLLSG